MDSPRTERETMAEFWARIRELDDRIREQRLRLEEFLEEAEAMRTELRHQHESAARRGRVGRDE